MKKNISINLQGIIFHIEEDGYEVLGRYLTEVKAHFSGYRGHEEIVADIEGRIAELFSARLSGLKQVITLEDVEAMTAKMGRVRDFQAADDAEDDDELLAEAVANGTAQGTYTGPGPDAGSRQSGSHAGSRASGTSSPDPNEPKRLYRDMANRKIAGVAAGVARYFAVNPLWIRLGFLGLLLLPPIIFDDSWFPGNLDSNLSGLAVISYIILWIALPKRYDAPPEQEDASYKKLYRDTDNGKVGGVSAGLAAYLNTDVTLVRVLFIVGVFVGGISFILYPLLWILVPEARTMSEKMRMRGDAVTLSGIDSNLRNNAYGPGVGNNRPLGTFFEDLASALNPLLNFVGSAIRIFAGVLLTVLGFVFLLSFAILLGVGVGLIPESDNIVTGAMPAYIFLNGVPTWAVFCFFLMLAIPAVALLLGGLGLLLRRTILHRSVSLSLLALWLLGIVGSSVAGTRLAREYQRKAEVTQTLNLQPLTAKRLVLERRWNDVGHYTDLDLIPVDSGQTPRLEQVLTARGATEEEARRTATTSLLYSYDTPNDSTLMLDDHFSYQPGARFRSQEMRLRLLLPRDRTFRMNESFANWIDDDQYVDGRSPKDAEKHVYRLRGNRIECADCTSDDLNGEERDDYRDGADEDRDNTNIRLDFGQLSTFSTDESSYGSGRRTYDKDDFDRISVAGPYHVVVRAGDSYSVKAAGNSEALDDLEVERDGKELVIKSKRRGMFGSHWRNSAKVLLTIEVPELNYLELVGAAQADVRGFGRGDLQIEQAGASQLHLQGTFDKLSLELAGGCRTQLSGNAEELKAEGAGGCELAAADFTVRTASVDMVGASKARVHVTDDLEADAVGASVVEYSGNPSNVRKDAVGASRVESVRD